MWLNFKSLEFRKKKKDAYRLVLEIVEHEKSLSEMIQQALGREWFHR